MAARERGDVFGPDWDEPSGDEAFRDMKSTLTKATVFTPDVPTWAMPNLRRSRFGWAWGTVPDVSSWVCYSMFGEMRGSFPSQVERCLEPGREDFWMAGHRGYGTNSMAFGLICRSGPILIWQQMPWGGGYMDVAATTEMLNKATEMAWGETCPQLETLKGRDLYLAVFSSDLRGAAEIWVRAQVRRDTRPRARGIQPPGWSTLWSIDEDTPEGLAALANSPLCDISVAASHLLRLLDCTQPSWRQRTRAGAAPGSIPSHQNPASVPAPLRLPADEDHQHIGLDELIEAILAPAHDSHSDRSYWRQFVELTCLDLGLDGRTRYLTKAIERIPSAVLPMQGALEVPQEISAGFSGIPDVRRRVEAVQRQMLDLQRQFFRNVLTSIEPRVVSRHTTIGRLRELGLQERSTFSYDDF